MKVCISIFTVFILFISCDKDVEEKRHFKFEQKGHLDGVMTGDVSILDWNKFQSSGNITQMRFNKINLKNIYPALSCDSVNHIAFSSFIAGYNLAWNWSLYINDTLLKSELEIHVINNNKFKNYPSDTTEICQSFPSFDLTLIDSDATLSRYSIDKRMTNYLQLYWIGNDTIIGTFKIYFVSDKEDFFFKQNSDVNKLIFFECNKFVAVRDTSL